LSNFHYHIDMKKHGFLSPNLPALIANIRKNGACQFAVAEAFSELGMCALRDMEINPACPQQVLGAPLFGRAVMSFQSAIILCERGLLLDAGILVRSAAETAIMLTAVAKDGRACKTLTLGMMHHERALAQSWLHDPEVKTVLSMDDIDALQSRIDEIDKNYPDAKDLEGDPIKVRSLADTYGTASLYNVVYRTTSGNAAHASLGTLKRHVKNVPHLALQRFKFGPEEENLAATLSDALMVISHALTSIYRLFPQIEHREDFEASVAAWKSLAI